MCGAVDVPVMPQLRVMSIYEGFFSGGARALHSAVVARSAHRRQSSPFGAEHPRRDAPRDDPAAHGGRRLLPRAARRRGRGRRARPARRRVHRRPQDVQRRRGRDRGRSCRGRRHRPVAQGAAAAAGQPAGLPPPAGDRVPALLRLEHQGGALGDLRTAVADGRVAAAICCAESTRAAYARRRHPVRACCTSSRTGSTCPASGPSRPAAAPGLRRAIGGAGEGDRW